MTRFCVHPLLCRQTHLASTTSALQACPMCPKHTPALNGAFEPVLGYGVNARQDSSILYLRHDMCCVLHEFQQSFDFGCLLPPLQTLVQCTQLRLYCCLSRNELVLQSSNSGLHTTACLCCKVFKSAMQSYRGRRECVSQRCMTRTLRVSKGFCICVTAPSTFTSFVLRLTKSL